MVVLFQYALSDFILLDLIILTTNAKQYEKENKNKNVSWLSFAAPWWAWRHEHTHKTITTIYAINTFLISESFLLPSFICYHHCCDYFVMRNLAWYTLLVYFKVWNTAQFTIDPVCTVDLEGSAHFCPVFLAASLSLLNPWYWGTLEPKETQGSHICSSPDPHFLEDHSHFLLLVLSLVAKVSLSFLSEKRWRKEKGKERRGEKGVGGRTDSW